MCGNTGNADPVCRQPLLSSATLMYHAMLIVASSSCIDEVRAVKLIFFVQLGSAFLVNKTIQEIIKNVKMESVFYQFSATIQ